ncbi:MAG: citrate/2-methylcitrate synthase [Streptosporangiaceae bacterium]
MTTWIGAAEAAQRLGIKQASLYSYVSRGVLIRRRDRDGRGSLFDATEIEGLARRGRPRRAPGSAEIVIESALTEISDDRLRYRGEDAIALAADRSLEEVAELLWTGTLGQSPPAEGWQATAQALAAARAAQAALPTATFALERLQVIVPAMAATDPLRLHLDRPAVMAAARAMIAGMVGSLPSASRGPARPAAAGGCRGTIAERLATRLSPRPLSSALTSALRSALVLLVDHELAASTLAARVAASVRADPYAVVATGLGAVSGALHGGASLGAEMMLASAAGPGDAPRVVGDLLRRGEKIPGFGHFVYRSGDPRAVLLLTLLARAAPRSPRLAIAQAVAAEARRRALPEPNIDFALAVLAGVAGMIPGASEAVFAVARTAGWLAHAMEEYAADAPIRPRGIYTGPPAVPG